MLPQPVDPRKGGELLPALSARVARGEINSLPHRELTARVRSGGRGVAAALVASLSLG